MADLELLPAEDLIVTGPVDHADWNYRRTLGWLSRRRFHLIDRLIGGRRFERLLEVGYGSGIFLPHLRRCARELVAIDIHSCEGDVGERLARHGITARLLRCSVTATPFAPDAFDCVVCVSALEFVADSDAACREICRILRPGGELLVVTPGASPIADLGLRLCTGQSAALDYGERRTRARRSLERHFVLVRRLTFPARPFSPITLYTAMALAPLAAPGAAPPSIRRESAPRS